MLGVVCVDDGDMKIPDANCVSWPPFKEYNNTTCHNIFSYIQIYMNIHFHCTAWCIRRTSLIKLPAFNCEQHQWCVVVVFSYPLDTKGLRVLKTSFGLCISFVSIFLWGNNIQLLFPRNNCIIYFRCFLFFYLYFLLLLKEVEDVGKVLCSCPHLFLYMCVCMLTC